MTTDMTRHGYRLAPLAVLMGVLLVPFCLLAQEELPAQHGSVELGARVVTGQVDGRPDLPFRPSLTDGKLNEYRDLRTGPFVRNLQANWDFSRTYFALRSHSSLYKDQSWLAQVGQLGRYKVQFRFDQTPHVFTNTARTLYQQSAPGAWTMDPATRTTLGGYYSAIGTATVPKLQTALANFNSVINPNAGIVDSSLIRKRGTADVSFNPTANWDLSFQFWRERETGLRPIGVSISGGSAEVPETVDYTTHNYGVQSEYGKHSWAVRLGYHANTFTNNVPFLAVDNPFVTKDATNATALGKLSLYPDNRYDSFEVAGATDLTSRVHVMTSVVPGWAAQNQPLMQYTTNTARPQQAWGQLPETRADAKVQTLAVNYTVTTKVRKDLQVKAAYRSYDRNNNTPIADFYPVVTDGAYAATQPASAIENTAFGYNRKTAELVATWFFSKKNSLKAGYNYERMDRSEREVSRTQESSLVTSLDLNPRKDLLVRVAYTHADRSGQAFAYASDDPNYAYSLLVDARRFDVAPRYRDRGDVMVQYSPTNALSLSGSFGTVQDNYNRRLGNELAAPNPFPGMGAFYNYGLLKNIGRNYTFDADYVLTSAVSVFGEYTREKYNTKMALLSNTTMLNGAPINAYANSNNDLVDTWSGGVDTDLTRRVAVTMFYSLSAAKGNILNSPINCTMSFDQCRALKGWSLDTAALPLVTMNYPETVTRLHQVTAQVKFNLTSSFVPKIEYIFEKFDNVDFQTGVMNPYTPSVQDSSNNSYLFLGADNPGYHAHILSVSLEYHF
jgi:MtrB/PioB family decaheme-associated outer membrane protein